MYKSLEFLLMGCDNLTACLSIAARAMDVRGASQNPLLSSVLELIRVQSLGKFFTSESVVACRF